MKESARYILPILVLVALILALGTFGYLVLEDGISAHDAFYMTVTAISPAQFEEVHELSVRGRYFTVVLVFIGFGAVVAFATQFARLIVQSELEGVGVISRKQMSRRISRMKNHYIVCGFGEIGGAICGELQNQGLPFVVISEDENTVATLNREGYPMVRGNATADSSLKEAGIESAVGVISVLTDDADNLFISLAARELNPKILIIARGEDPSLRDRILRAGADIVVSPMTLGGRQIAELIKQQVGASSLINEAPRKSGVSGLRLTPYRHTSVDPVTIQHVVDTSQAIGVAAVERKDGTFEENPARDVQVFQDDTVVVITRTDERRSTVQSASTGRTILLADDHRALRLLFTRKLNAAGHEVIQASNGEDALNKALTKSPDLIVLDVNMPKRNGYEVCATLRRNPLVAKTPIILYSGEQTDEFIKQGKDAGADICIRKTSKSSDLLAKIEEVFSRKVNDANSPSNRNESVEPDPPAAISHNLQPALDLSLAKENVDGDETLLMDLFSSMLTEIPQLLTELGTALEKQDRDALRAAAHTLKSTVAIVGATYTASLSAELEQSAMDETFDRLSALHTTLESRIARLMTEIQDQCRASTSDSAR